MTSVLQFVADNALPLTVLAGVLGMAVGWLWPL